MNTKQLLSVCKVVVQRKIDTIEQRISSTKEALNSETKSSAGDKHETGRAMLQLEMEKAGQQLKELMNMKLQLEKIETTSSVGTIKLGSVVITDQQRYYLSVGLGKIELDEDYCYAISIQSPIGKLLLGKSKGDRIEFRNQSIKIKEVY